jgi:hypothetical protein
MVFLTMDFTGKCHSMDFRRDFTARLFQAGWFIIENIHFIFHNSKGLLEAKATSVLSKSMEKGVTFGAGIGQFYSSFGI